MSTALIVLGILVGVYVLSQIISSAGPTQTPTRRDTRGKVIPMKTASKEEVEKGVFYLSEFDELLKRYKISIENPDAFFDMLSGVVKDGKVYAKKELMKAVETQETVDPKTQAEKFLTVYSKLSETPPVLEFVRGAKDKNSPKIYSTALESWATKFGLERELKDNPEQTFIRIIKENLYQYGINSTLERVKVFKTNLEKELASKNLEMVGKLMDMIKKELDELS